MLTLSVITIVLCCTVAGGYGSLPQRAGDCHEGGTTYIHSLADLADFVDRVVLCVQMTEAMRAENERLRDQERSNSAATAEVCFSSLLSCMLCLSLLADRAHASLSWCAVP